jgi:hypothetical protein
MIESAPYHGSSVHGAIRLQREEELEVQEGVPPKAVTAGGAVCVASSSAGTRSASRIASEYLPPPKEVEFKV